MHQPIVMGVACLVSGIRSTSPWHVVQPTPLATWIA